MKKVLLGAAVALMLAPAAPVEAAYYCAPAASGGFTACASINVSFNAGVITVRVTNEDLWAIAQGYDVQTTGYSITGFGIEAPDAGNVTLAGVTIGGGAIASPDLATAADEWSFVSNLSGFQVEAGATSSGVTGGILGCLGEYSVYFRTCAGGVTTGYVEFTFNTDLTEFDANAVLIALRMQGEDDISYRCTDDPTATNGVPCGTTTTVPEPFSALLLGTGLMAIGGAARRRNRKDED